MKVVSPSQEDDTRSIFSEWIEESALQIGELGSVRMSDKVMYLAPWLTDKQVNVIHGEKGKGKTWFSLALAVALTHGLDFGDRWTHQNAAGVLYIDGEMPIQDLRERILALSHGNKQVAPFGVLSSDYMFEKVDAYINISDAGIRMAISDYLRAHPQYRVVFIDNKASLAPFGDENQKGDYDAINQWLLSLKRSGLAVFLVHHSNKSGGLRGTSAIADNPEYIINLTQKKSDDDGTLTLLMRFEKNRGIYAEDAEPFLWKMRSESVVRDDGRKETVSASWSVQEVTRSNYKSRITGMLVDGLSIDQIVDEMGCSKSTVYRMAKEAKRAGLIGDADQ